MKLSSTTFLHLCLTLKCNTLKKGTFPFSAVKLLSLVLCHPETCVLRGAGDGGLSLPSAQEEIAGFCVGPSLPTTVAFAFEWKWAKIISPDKWWASLQPSIKVMLIIRWGWQRGNMFRETSSIIGVCFSIVWVLELICLQECGEIVP